MGGAAGVGSISWPTMKDIGDPGGFNHRSWVLNPDSPVGESARTGMVPKPLSLLAIAL
jgi:hypothetical protein